MAGRIFRSTLKVALGVLVAGLIVIMGILYPYFTQMQRSQLRDELALAADATERLGTDYLQRLDSDRYRLTWVAADGTVIYDNQADASGMGNHADREEIHEAMETGSGSSTRRSATLTEQTMYEARRLADGTVLRISVSTATALLLLLGMARPICILAVLAIALSAWLSRRVAADVVRPLNELNLDAPLENDIYDEISPLLRRIHIQQQQIRSQMLTLKEKKEEFARITDNLCEALILMDGEGRVLTMNPAVQRLYGLSTVEAGADILSVDRGQDMRMALEETRTRGHASFRETRDGMIYQFDMNRIDSERGTYGMALIAFDITDQVNAERNRQEFTANVSHELKTPLQSIIGSAELLENGIVREEDVPRFVGRIRAEAERLVALIDDIIKLSQLDEGDDMPREDVSLLALAQEVRGTLADAAAAKDITLEVDGDDGVVNGVRRLLYEIVYNLCDNAIKYNKVGGRVDVTIRQTGDKVRLAVADTGIGIAPEYRDKVFERFFRVDKSHSKQSGGTGLGLSIVKHAVQYHHAQLDIKSEPGKGTEISVILRAAMR